MRPFPRRFTDDEALYTAALSALMRRAHSVFEMRSYLERRAADPALARRVLDRLKRENLLDDARYALSFARWRAQSRRQGPRRIAQELRARGVPDRHIEAALRETFAETDEGALVRQVIERRIRAARGPLDNRRFAALYRTLLRAGFDAGLVRRELLAAWPEDGSHPEESEA